MNKEFDVNETVDLPDYIIYKNIEDFWIIIAPNYPNWIVLDDAEFQMFKNLSEKKFSIMETMDDFCSKNDTSEDRVIEIMTKLLGKIEEVEFYNQAETSEEEPVEQIQKLVHINLTNNCNLRCKHCYMSAGKFKEEQVDFFQLQKILTKINELKRHL